MNRGRLVRWVSRSALLGVTAFSLIALAHAPPFRRLLARAACPIGGDLDATPAQREATRVRGLEARRGTSPAPSRDVRGLVLGITPVDAARASLGLADCTVDRAGLVHECRTSTETVFLRTDEGSRLVALASVRRASLNVAPVRAAQELASWSARLGAPHTQLGTFDAETLGAGLLAQARAEWRFVDLVASVTATRVDADEVVITLEAQVIPTTLAANTAAGATTRLQ
ncbi:MAG: hypothetical protein MUC96_32585 [Myxococcaceae bacterium]|nr:hypothetical protein [Myxococcaceae bacterium]